MTAWADHGPSVGFTITGDIREAIGKVPAGAWTPAYDGDGQVRDGAWVADITGLLDLSSWPAGMRVIARKERPHPGAQLRFTGIDGHRFTCLATDANRGQLAALELRHRRRARCEDRSSASPGDSSAAGAACGCAWPNAGLWAGEITAATALLQALPSG
jgi:Transposase DDE domain group 1